MALTIAADYQPYERLYFPHQMDSRGRAYPVPGIMNPQASEHIRSLLEFADGLSIENESQLKWLAIAGANAYGQDKISLNLRYDWVLDNSDMILSIASDFKTDHRWMQAAEPFSFLRFCLEWARFKAEGYRLQKPFRLHGRRYLFRIAALCGPIERCPARPIRQSCAVRSQAGYLRRCGR